MGIQINGNTDNISASDGGLTVSDLEINQSGISTFNAGVNVSGGQLDVGSNIKIGNAGVITATSFVGSGANLTSLPAQATIANNADNRVITGGSGVNLNGESNLTFNGSTLDVTSSTRVFSPNGTVRYQLGVDNSSGVSIISKNAAGSYNGYQIDANAFTVRTTVSNIGSLGERFRINSSGQVGIGTNNPQKKLEVFDATQGVIRIRGGAGGSNSSRKADLSLFASGAREYVVRADASDAAFKIVDVTGSNTERLRIGSNGYVNIGTGAPEQQLTVQNSAQHSLIRVISKNDSDAGIDFGDVDDTDRAGIRYTNSTDTLTINANANTRVVIDSSGRVMIGGGSSPSQVGDGQLIVYSSDRLHPSIKCAGMSNNYANGWTLLGDNYQADESQINLGVSYSSSSLVLSRGVKVSGSADNTYLSSQDTYAMRPCAIRLDDYGAFNFLTTETNATVATDSAVSLTEVFKVDRVGNIYQRISDRNLYLGASNQLRIGVQGNGDPNIEAVSGDLKLMKSGSSIMQLRSDGFEMKQDIYFGTAGKGICLGTTSNTDANTLDDYEEGTFNCSFQTNSGSFPSQSAVGRYTKIGRTVHIQGQIFWGASDGSGSGLLWITLPFTNTSATRGGIAPGLVSGLDFDTEHQLYVMPEINSTNCYMLQSKPNDPAGGHAHLSPSSLRNYASRAFSFGGTYMVN